MADNQNSFEKTVESLFKGMDGFISTKTVVGDAVTLGDTIIVPLADVSFGVGAGAFSNSNKSNGGGGISGKVTPSAVLIIQNSQTKLINIRNQDSVTKILDMVPDVINKFSKGKSKKVNIDEAEAAVRKAEAMYDKETKKEEP